MTPMKRMTPQAVKENGPAERAGTLQGSAEDWRRWRHDEVSRAPLQHTPNGVLSAERGMGGLRREAAQISSDRNARSVARLQGSAAQPGAGAAGLRSRISCHAPSSQIGQVLSGVCRLFTLSS